MAPADSKIELKIGPNFPLAATLGANRLTTGDPDSVPVGHYAREALTKLGVWNDVEKRLVRADSVRSALAFVDRGEAALGIVYATDAEIDKKVRVVDV
ncbi:MAG: molybdate ABC transporter substrate-binding protein [Steroidobacteraceae bacterium]